MYAIRSYYGYLYGAPRPLAEVLAETVGEAAAPGR